MAKNSIIISCVLTQSDIINKHVHAYLGMLAVMLGRLKNVGYFIAKVFLPFKKGMLEGI
jgi:hypothetical protein